MTGTNTQKHLQWVIESGAALVVVGVGLNALVMKTLGSFDAATVILALILGFWAFILGNTVLFLSSIWVFMRRREMAADIDWADTKSKGVINVLSRATVSRRRR